MDHLNKSKHAFDEKQLMVRNSHFALLFKESTFYSYPSLLQILEKILLEE